MWVGKMKQLEPKDFSETEHSNEIDPQYQLDRYLSPDEVQHIINCQTIAERIMKDKELELSKCKPRKEDGIYYCTCDCGHHKENGDY